MSKKYIVELQPTAEYGAEIIAQETEAWYRGSVGSQPMPTPEEAVEVARNIIEAQAEYKGDVGKYFTVVAIPYDEESDGE